ncbi:MAG: hypothetical protein OQJ95_01695 [Kangiella sp.]|jgi:hypothetical protein|nr:hypothetical protein [Kangiella sp.]
MESKTLLSILFSLSFVASGKVCDKQDFIKLVQASNNKSEIMNKCPEMFLSRTEDSLSLFSWLIKTGRYELVASILNDELYFSNLTAVEKSNFLFDTLAADMYGYELLILLINHGADPNKSRIGNIGIIYDALERGKIKALLKLKKVVSQKIYFESLNIFAAIKSNNLEYVKEYFEFNGCISVRDENGFSTLDYINNYEVSSELELLVKNEWGCEK